MAYSHNISLWDSGNAFGIKLSDQGTNIQVQDATQTIASDTVGYSLRVNDVTQAITSETRTLNNHDPGVSILSNVGSFNLTTQAAGGTQSITGVGFTPKLVLFWYTGIHESGSAAKTELQNDAGFGVATSASSRWVTMSYVAPAQISTSYGYSSSGSVLAFYNNLAWVGRLDISSMNVDGFTLNVITAVTIDYKVSYLALGGDELSDVYVGTYTVPTSTGSFAITEVGFEPSAVIFSSVYGTAVEKNNDTQGTYNLGFAVNDGNCGAKNTVVAGFSLNSSGLNNSVGYGYNSESVALISAIATMPIREAVMSFTNDGFIVNHLEGASARVIFYVALRGGKYELGEITTRTDTNDVLNTIGFKPSAILFASANRPLSTQDTPSVNNYISIGAISGSSSNVQAVHNYDNVDLGLADEIYYDGEVYASASSVYPNTWVNGLMKVKSIEDTGFTTTMDAVDLAENWVTYLAIGGMPTVAAVLTVQDITQLQTSDKTTLSQIFTLTPNDVAHVQTSDIILLNKHNPGDTVLSKVGSFNLDLMGENETQPITGIGFAPKVILFWFSGIYNTSASSLINDQNVFGLGAATSASSRWLTNNIVAPGAISNATRYSSSGSIANFIYNLADSGKVDISSLDNDGFTLVARSEITLAYKISYLALGGDELKNAYLGTYTTPTYTGSFAVTDVGFEPSAVISSTISGDIIEKWGISNAYLSLGFAANDGNGGANNSVISSFVGDLDGSNRSYGYGYNQEYLAVITDTPSYQIITRESITSFTNNGFIINSLEGTTARIVFYVALQGGRYSVGELTTRTDTNDITNTVGFKPSAILFASANRALSTQDTVSASSLMSLGTISGSNSVVQSVSNFTFSEDGCAAMIYYEDRVYASASGIFPSAWLNGTMRVKSIENTGFTTVMSNVDLSPNWVTYLAIGGVAPSGTTTYTLTIQDVSQLQTSENINLLSHYAIVTNDVTQLQTSDNTEITFLEIEDIELIVNYTLVVQDVIHLQTSENVILSAHYVIAVQDTTHLQTSENVALTQTYYYNLTVQDATQLQTSENIALTQHQVLTINDATQLQTSDNITLTQHQVLTINDVTQLQTSENIVLTQHQVLTINDAIHLQTSENIALIQHQVLTINDSTQLQASDNLTVTYNSGTVTLTVQDATQLHTSENVILNAHYSLVVQDLTQLQTSENVALTQHQVLTVNNATQLQTSEKATITFHNVLVVNNTTQAQTANNIILKEHPYANFMLQQDGFYLLQETGYRIILQAEGVEVKNATQAQTADNVSLIQHQVLTINDATHLQTSDNTNLVQYTYGTLTIQDAIHLQTSDNILLTQHQILTTNDAVHLQTSDNITLVGKFTITVNDASQAQYTFEVAAETNDYILTKQYFGIYGIPLLYFPLELSRELNLIFHSPTGALVVQNTTQLQNADNVDLSAHYAIVVQDATQSQTAENISLSAHYAITAQDATQIQVSENINLLAHYAIVTSDATQLQTAENVSLNAHYAIVTSDATQLQTAENVSLNAHYAIVTNDATQIQSAENLNLNAHYAIITNDATQLQTSDNVNLFAHYTITVQDATQLQTSDNVNLSAHYTITIQDATQLQTSENVSLFAHYTIAAQDATQLQTSENIALIQHQVLTINDATQLQSAENIALVQHQVLTVNDTTHLQTSDNVSLTQHQVLIINDSAQLQTAENINLLAHYTISVNDATQIQTAENVILSAHYTITINDAIQLQTSETVTLTQHHVLSINDATQIQTSETIDLVQHQIGLLVIDNAIQPQTSDTITLATIPPNFILAADYILSDGGLSTVNGYYNNSGTLNGKIYWKLSTDSDIRIWWNGAVWVIGKYSTSTTYYYSTDDVRLPELATSWITFIPGGGIAPQPTIFSKMNAVQTQTAENATVIPLFSITVKDATQLQTSESITLSAHYTLTVNDATQLQTSDNINVVERQTIIVNDATQLQTSDNINLSAHYSITVNDAIHLQTSENINLTAHYAIIVNDATHIQTSENISLTAHYALQVNDATQIQTSDNVNLIQHQTLTVNDTVHLQTSDNISLTGSIALTVNNATQLQTSDNVNLSAHYAITVNDATQLQSADNVDLNQNIINTLSVQDATQLHFADNIDLTQHQVLTVNDATQAQTSDNVNLSAHYSLIVNDTIHLQTAEEINLIYHNVLIVEDCTHNQIADNVTLIQNYLLLVSNTVHLQTSDTINLAQNYILVSNNVTQLQNADNVTLSTHAQTFALILQDAIQNQTAENVVLLTRIIIFLTAYMLTSIQGASILKRTVDKPSFSLTSIKGDSQLKKEFENDSYVQESVQGTTFTYNKKI